MGKRWPAGSQVDRNGRRKIAPGSEGLARRQVTVPVRPVGPQPVPEQASDAPPQCRIIHGFDYCLGKK